MREIKLRYTFQHNETGRIASVIKNLDDEGPYLDHPSNKWTLLGRDQYTGLKDNNGKPIYLELHPNIGKEIYESDIVNVTFPNGGRVRAIIEWHQLAWCYKSLFALDDSMNSQPFYNNPYPHYTHLHCVGYQFELIGTIHENPELLEETSGD